MIRTTSRALLAALATSVALVTAACNSSTPPTPSPVAQTVAPTSIAPTAAPPATPNPTSAASPTPEAIGPGSWNAAAPIIDGHSYGATATALLDGRVLVTGGEGDSLDATATAAADLFDPATGLWTPTHRMFVRRRGHVATLLADGRVLVAGGLSYSALPTDFGEIFDPKTETWTKTPRMTHSRYDPTATLLADGRVLVAGGLADGFNPTRRAEIYDPIRDTWTATRNMPSPAGQATLLGDGQVLVMSNGPSVETFATFDPATGRWRKVTNAPTDLRWGSTAVRLTNGGVLYLNSQMAKGELYDPSGNTWTAIDVPHAGDGPAVLLNDGTVLVVGKVSSARFDPVTGAYSAVGRPPMGRDYALDSIDGVEVNLIAELPDGRVFATSFGSTAIYDPNGHEG